MKKFFFIGVFILLLFASAIYHYNNLVRKNYSIEFNGKVEKVIYSIKGEPTVSINGKTFDLPVNLWDFNHKIEKGDSLIKSKDSMVIKLIKYKTGQVIFCN
ncbi:hypothetical protein DIU31_026620 [Mucilaginibacter rubeus]|uniref:Uncharacterized protein n=1 Tax=Mucilaginibacter rubeus TaxID=2027860 RepID=A0AAE6MKQ7_9SPHI|nr:MULTISPECIES: hypothetical protein [Mucilaginibacter]QEM06906.1 hypothetical protein DIU31_026620 [Mucilaginibacter rubeus]QEM19494.1 hypothetical protein DIU38_026915 [Mucilaginibacter gossypii]QTE43956.1 hypothetical protein J3L19_00815 [Mucilaginibacter rubeus]QTE50557.1 hypothetical protein J3L21_00800 [Mucilaginibacter rubeus]QTE55642.1 hypothetical protein J3L23_26035 [Mucilaginibacter rubeus]